MTHLFCLLLGLAHAGVFSDLCAKYLVMDSFEGDPDESLVREAERLGIRAKWGRLDQDGWRRLRAIENELAFRRQIQKMLYDGV